MNLSNSRRTELTGVPFLNNVLDYLIARINQLWAVEHDPESGAHTAITATSVTLANEASDDEGNIGSSLIPLTTDTYTLGTQRTELPGSPYLAWKELYLTDRFDWIGTATSAVGNAIPSWQTTMTGDNLATLAPVGTSQQWTFTASGGTVLLRLGNAISIGGAAVTSGTFIEALEVTSLGVDALANDGTLIERGKVTPAQITGNQNNYNPTGLSTARVLRLTSDASRNITGIVAQEDGRRITLQNAGAQDIVLVDNDTANSTAANCFLCPGAVNFTLNRADGVEIEYDGTSQRWLLIAT